LWFGDVHAPGWRGTITALLEVMLEFPEQPLHSVHVLHICQGDAVHPSGPAIGPDSFPRLPQHVTSVDTVKKGVETPLLRLLGRSP
jgi:hypothetical protein